MILIMNNIDNVRKLKFHAETMNPGVYFLKKRGQKTKRKK